MGPGKWVNKNGFPKLGPGKWVNKKWVPKNGPRKMGSRNGTPEFLNIFIWDPGTPQPP